MPREATGAVHPRHVASSRAPGGRRWLESRRPAWTRARRCPRRLGAAPEHSPCQDRDLPPKRPRNTETFRKPPALLQTGRARESASGGRRPWTVLPEVAFTERACPSAPSPPLPVARPEPLSRSAVHAALGTWGSDSYPPDASAGHAHAPDRPQRLLWPLPRSRGDFPSSGASGASEEGGSGVHPVLSPADTGTSDLAFSRAVSELIPMLCVLFLGIPVVEGRDLCSSWFAPHELSLRLFAHLRGGLLGRIFHSCDVSVITLLPPPCSGPPDTAPLILRFVPPSGAAAVCLSGLLPSCLLSAHRSHDELLGTSVGCVRRPSGWASSRVGQVTELNPQ